MLLGSLCPAFHLQARMAIETLVQPVIATSLFPVPSVSDLCEICFRDFISKIVDSLKPCSILQGLPQCKRHLTMRCAFGFLFLIGLFDLSHGAFGDDNYMDKPWRPSPPTHSTRLFCPNMLLLTTYGETLEKWSYRARSLPVQDWSYRNFSSLTNLCSARGKKGANMGGEV